MYSYCRPFILPYWKPNCATCRVTNQSTHCSTKYTTNDSAINFSNLYSIVRSYFWSQCYTKCVPVGVSNSGTCVAANGFTISLAHDHSYNKPHIDTLSNSDATAHQRSDSVSNYLNYFPDNIFYFANYSVPNYNSCPDDFS